MAKCETCGIEYQQTNPKQKYCDAVCKRAKYKGVTREEQIALTDDNAKRMAAILAQQESQPAYRVELQNKLGQRETFTATVERFGKKRGYKGEEQTILFVNVKDASGQVVTDHIWFKAGSWSARLEPGDVVKFDARVSAYGKGYQGQRADVDKRSEIDYRLERPTKVSVLTDQ